MNKQRDIKIRKETSMKNKSLPNNFLFEKWMKELAFKKMNLMSWVMNAPFIAFECHILDFLFLFFFIFLLYLIFSFNLSEFMKV